MAQWQYAELRVLRWRPVVSRRSVGAGGSVSSLQASTLPIKRYKFVAEDSLRDFYNNLSDEEVTTLASKLDIDNAEDLISIFNKTPFIMTTDEYIENIKKCYF